MPNQRRQYTEEEFKEAIAAIRDGSMSIRRAAHVYTLPKSTLCDYIKKNTDRQCQCQLMRQYESPTKTKVNQQNMK